MTNLILELARDLSSPVERRLFAEYGAVFVTRAQAPPRVVFSGPQEVDSFQESLAIRGGRLGDHYIELQAEAMDALLAAACELSDGGFSLTPRAADSARRSYQDTIRLWTRNVTRGLEHWTALGQLSKDRARVIRALEPPDQVAPVLELEQEEQLYFGTYFDKSILYSVAAPGASQHLSLLAFDAAEFQEPATADALARHGWHRTVAYDFPHFTYLGYTADTLPNLGLKRVIREYNDRPFCFWVPAADIDQP